MTTVVRLHPGAISNLATDRRVIAVLKHVGDQVADRAAATAPRSVGGLDHGADSIRAEVADDGSVRVSWDQAHFYMAFQELGTSRMTARPFLRPALDARYDT